MPVEIKPIRSGEIARLRRKLGPELIREPLRPVFRGAAAFAQREAEGGAPRDINATIRPFMTEVTDFSAKVRTATGTARVIEFGRHAGKRQPPVDAIAAWAERRGLAAEAAFPIARAIARRGIKGRFFMRRARAKLLRGELPRLMGQARDEILRRWLAS